MEHKVHCNVRNSPPHVPVLSQIYPAHVFLSSLFQIHFNIILPNTHRPSKQSHSFRFPHQNPLFIFFQPHMCPTSHPSQICVILSPNYLTRSANNEVPQNATFSSLMLPFPPQVHVSSSLACSQTSLSCVSHLMYETH